MSLDGLDHALRHQRLVLLAMLEPNEVQVNLFGEGSQQRKHIHYLCGLRR